jgi:hypothetical protein
MIGNKKKSSAPLHLIAFVALTLGPLLASSSASEDYVRQYAPLAPPAPVPAQWPLKPAVGGETRIFAARPAAAEPADAAYGMDRDADAARPRGRLRLRPANFGGM